MGRKKRDGEDQALQERDIRSERRLDLHGLYIAHNIAHRGGYWGNHSLGNLLRDSDELLFRILNVFKRLD